MTTTLGGAGARLWSPAGHPSFRLLWLAQALSQLGHGFSYIAFAWVTLTLTDSTLALGYVLAFQAVPRAVLTLVGGSLGDRWSPRLLMVLSSWARSGLMAAVGLAALTGTLTLWMLCAAAALFGAVDAFFQPARVAILPRVVDRETLTQANALLGAGARVCAVLGPALGGVVVAFTNAGVAFLVDAACFAVCALCVSGIRTRRKTADETTEGDGDGPDDGADSGLIARIGAGVRYAWGDARIRCMLAVDVAVTFCYAGPFTIGFAALARGELEGGSMTLGLLNGALAAGATLGALVGGTVSGRPRVGLLVAGLAGWLAVGMGVLGVLDSAAVAVGTVLTMGFAIGFQGVFGLSWLQRNVPESVLTRVISLDMVLGYAIAPVSLLMCGALADTGTGAMFGIVALILALTGLGTLASRPVRAMR
ncbi:MFS transporter [Streptomyces alkaliphilus]|uniref:MFS transporter n=1 Tax=Streptomyces alkaliphilus TaxID=1472722 RepID=A0A7W3TBL8_9ACTN|nr:MFS transporter [Streptomyces alkaliphilus]MBB0243844.1 MFS transporter [Streptomyces alkaliphilus]MQS07165.1 MFS transporter [Streptomyces alkaliphilus]